MDWNKVLDTIKAIIPKIKAKVQSVKNLSFNITIAGKIVNVNLPQDTDLNKIESIPPELEDRIAEKVLMKLKEHEDYLDSIPEDERLQKITDATSGALIDVGIHETLVLSGSVDVQLERKKP